MTSSLYQVSYFESHLRPEISAPYNCSSRVSVFFKMLSWMGQKQIQPRPDWSPLIKDLIQICRWPSPTCSHENPPPPPGFLSSFKQTVIRGRSLNLWSSFFCSNSGFIFLILQAPHTFFSALRRRLSVIYDPSRRVVFMNTTDSNRKSSSFPSRSKLEYKLPLRGRQGSTEL